MSVTVAQKAQIISEHRRAQGDTGSPEVQVALLTARKSAMVTRRARELGIERVMQGAADKHAGYRELLAACALQPDCAGYAGDDLMDLPVLLDCAFAASVPGAAPAVRDRVHYVTRCEGGGGAVREICEFILHAQGRLDEALAPYLTARPGRS